MRILQVAPLCRALREGVERGEVALDPSVSLLEDASFLVFAKAKWLLPQTEVVEMDSQTEPVHGIEEREESPALLDPREFREIVETVDQLLQSSRHLFGRGYTTSLDEIGRVETAAIESLELARIMESLIKSAKPRGRAVRILRKNFSEHVRWFFKEVKRLVSRYSVLWFSRFTGGSAQDSVLNFLVLLELIKRRRLFAAQGNVFGEILFSTKKDKIEEFVDEPGREPYGQ